MQLFVGIVTASLLAIVIAHPHRNSVTVEMGLWSLVPDSNTASIDKTFVQGEHRHGDSSESRASVIPLGSAKQYKQENITIAVFEEPDWRGRSGTLNAPVWGCSNLSVDWNDKIASIKIPAGAKYGCFLYRGWNCDSKEGMMTVMTSPLVADLSTFSHTVSSYICFTTDIGRKIGNPTS